MPAAESREIQKVRLLKDLLAKHLAKNKNEEVFLSFDSLRSFSRLLEDRMGVEKVLNIIKRWTNEEISFEIIKERLQMPETASNILYGPQMSEPYPVAIAIHVSDPTKLDKYFDDVIAKLSESAPQAKSNLYFDSDKSRLYVRGKEILIQKFSDQYHSLRIIFADPKDVAKEWFFSEIAERVDVYKPNEKTYYNAVYQVGLKLTTAGFPEFFITTRQSAKINPKYLS